jgi:acetyl-CoA C-acetyltransferase
MRMVDTFGHRSTVLAHLAPGPLSRGRRPSATLHLVTFSHRAHIAGAFEHPGRHLPDLTLPQIHGDVAAGALADAGLSFSDVDAYYSAGDAPGFGALSMIDYMGLNCRYVDDTETGGSSYLVHVQHAAAAIAAGQIDVALITLAGKPRTGGAAPGGSGRGSSAPEAPFENPFGMTVPGGYALAAQRHMYEFGTTSRQLAEIKVAASQHAQHNPNAFLRDPVTIEEVLDSPVVADPLHRLDCCVITDGGGALVVVSDAVAASLDRNTVKVLGTGTAVKHTANGRIDLSYTGAKLSGPTAFAEAGVTPADVDYVSIYDSFTITVLITLEDLGFCEKGQGGNFVSDGNLQAGVGNLPFNTDGGGLCNNHPANRGGITKVIEAVRQLRGEAHPAVQVPDCEIALAHGTGGSLATRMGSSTLILGKTS